MNDPPSSSDVLAEAMELKAAIESKNRYTLLRLAVIVLKVIAVLYVFVGVGSLFLGSDDDAKLEGMALAIAIFRDVLVGFFTWVSGDVIKLQLEIKDDVSRIRAER